MFSRVFFTTHDLVNARKYFLFPGSVITVITVILPLQEKNQEKTANFLKLCNTMLV